ncbi:dihydrodipicolinate synthase family protein [Sinorhizobium americanum]|uniref:4-hydroxy-tetrahydrodipicolinate synthase n=1 Tax=Sinorhizobium americanum TaxID=194963 RepID=A0A1L3LLF5_9HYPH|nr:dihydrodipicolinate synthase family protein [Sinorhizobium americanum]APG84356.1 dihydrodipicolinate synthase DapA [Sinorhizobium americanum CCGM7]APG90904.1 dihydrodipicolinate synthase DapA [Sinorhizobium americanum]OAP46676.1 4-hydroxy-tetrahydrodipicolinate synthase [Sinorhizobium americanum]TCN25802.1 4-hydroxy-tetrahydrodipicolinate synthase [Sinorhizobium americanum]
MWRGVFPAVTTKFTIDGDLDKAEMERCFALQFEAGVDGMIVCGSLGENMTLEAEEKIEILKIAKSVAGGKPVLMTICESATRRGEAAARAATKAGADGFMVLPGVPYKSAPAETLAHIQAVATAGGLPIMVYNNPVAYGVDVTLSMFDELAKNELVVAMKESTDDIRRVTDVLTRFGERFDCFTGVDNLALESLLMGAHGWVAGLVVAFPKETVAIWKLVQAGHLEEARAIYRWFRPLLDLDVSTNLVQNIKLAEVFAIDSNDRVRAPRLPLAGAERQRVQGIIEAALAKRPTLPVL